MKQAIAKFLFKLFGWKIVGETIPEQVHRCVFVYAPHTSNWDYFYGVICMMSIGVPVKIAIKNYWTRFPYSLVVKPLGGVGIDRSGGPRGGRKSQVEKMAAIFDRYEKIAFIITPEASRSRRTKWKTGFYHIAKMADVPIVTFCGNFATREVEFGPVYYPGKDELPDVMKSMMAFYKKGVGQKPEEFALDDRYV